MHNYPVCKVLRFRRTIRLSKWNQPAQLICAFVVRIYAKSVFSYVETNVPNNYVFNSLVEKIQFCVLVRLLACVACGCRNQI